MIKKNLNPECGIRLKQCLLKSRITQKELAERSGYTQQYVSTIVLGKKNLSLEAARKFSKILNPQSCRVFSRLLVLMKLFYYVNPIIKVNPTFVNHTLIHSTKPNRYAWNF